MRNISKILPLVLFSAFSVKMIVYTPSLADGVVLGILAALIGYLEYKTSDKQYKLLEEGLGKINQDLNDLAREHKELKGFVSTMNLQNKMSPLNRRTGQP